MFLHNILRCLILNLSPPQNHGGDSAVSSTVDPMNTKRSKVKPEAEGLRPSSPCSPVRKNKRKLCFTALSLLQGYME